MRRTTGSTSLVHVHDHQKDWESRNSNACLSIPSRPIYTLTFCSRLMNRAVRNESLLLNLSPSLDDLETAVQADCRCSWRLYPNLGRSI